MLHVSCCTFVLLLASSRSLDREFWCFFLSPGEVMMLAVGAFLLTVKLLCLQSLKTLIRRTFPL